MESSRRRVSPTLAVLGSCLGVYVVLAVVFNWLIEPTVAKNHSGAAEPSQAAPIVQYSDPAFVPPVRAERPFRFALKPPASATVTAAAPASKEKTAAEVPKKTPKREVIRTTPRQDRPVREHRNERDFATAPSNGYRPWF